MQEVGITVNKQAKIHCNPGTVTREDHTIQDCETGLIITMQIRSIFSYFLTRKPFNEDFEEGVTVVITPEGAIWDAYDQNYADNEQSMTNRKGELHPPMYKPKEFVGEDDHANINSILVMDDNVYQHNQDAVIAAFDEHDVDFLTEKDLDIGYCMSKTAVTAVEPFFSDWNPVFESMLVGQDQVSAIIFSVSNTLDPQKMTYGQMKSLGM